MFSYYAVVWRGEWVPQSSCELPDVDVGSGTQVFCESSSHLNHWTTSPAQRSNFHSYCDFHLRDNETLHKLPKLTIRKGWRKDLKRMVFLLFPTTAEVYMWSGRNWKKDGTIITIDPACTVLKEIDTVWRCLLSGVWCWCTCHVFSWNDNWQNGLEMLALNSPIWSTLSVSCTPWDTESPLFHSLNIVIFYQSTED